MKRFENIECNLTPKEWAIRIVDEIRSHASEYGFYIAISNYPDKYEIPTVKPYSMMRRQVEKQHPGNRPEVIRERDRVGRKLFGEFHALKLLLFNTNQDMKNKAEIFKLKERILFWMLYTLVLKLKSILNCEAIDDIDSNEGDPNSQLQSLVEIFLNYATDLIVESFAYEEATKLIQEKYFDGHPFLYRDIEAILMATSKLIKETVSTFNHCFRESESTSTGKGDGGKNGAALQGENGSLLPVDIEKIKESLDRQLISEIAERWAKNAMDRATYAALENIDQTKADEFLWNLEKEEAKMLKTLDKP